MSLAPGRAAVHGIVFCMIAACMRAVSLLGRLYKVTWGTCFPFWAASCMQTAMEQLQGRMLKN